MRKETKKYYFTVEGETEKWYFEWLQRTINSTPAALYSDLGNRRESYG